MVTCPNQTPLGVMEGNVAHSVGKYGMKVSQYFPAVGGATCTSPTFSSPAVFRDFTVYKAGFVRPCPAMPPRVFPTCTLDSRYWGASRARIGTL